MTGGVKQLRLWKLEDGRSEGGCDLGGRRQNCSGREIGSLAEFGQRSGKKTQRTRF